MSSFLCDSLGVRGLTTVKNGMNDGNMRGHSETRPLNLAKIPIFDQNRLFSEKLKKIKIQSLFP